MARKTKTTETTETTEKTADMLKAEIEQLKAKLKEAKEAETVKNTCFVASEYKGHTIIYKRNGSYFEKLCSVKKLAEFLEYLDKHNGVLKLGELDFSNKEEPFVETGNTKIDL